MSQPDVVDLDDPQARNPQLVGAKAARLAAARAAGLGVLPGVVVTTAAAEPAFARGVAELDRPNGVGSARRQVLAVQPPPELLAEVQGRAAALGHPLIVRSSGSSEDAAVWSGAFASMADVELDDLATALRSCWASGFSPDALERREALDAPLSDLRLAALVQRELHTESAGTADVLPDGTVRVVGTTGPPAALMSGWRAGSSWIVEGVEPRRTGGADDIPAAQVVAVADLARSAAEDVGAGAIEWAVEDGSLYLLQCRPGETASGVSHLPLPVRKGLDHPLALRAARLLARYRGSDAERLVVPWALGMDDLPAPARAERDPEAALDHLADMLLVQAWGLPPAHAAAEARSALDELRSGDATAAVRRLQGCVRVDPAAAAELLALVATDAGAGPRAALLRWEPFLHDVARAHGRRCGGEGIVEGVGAGPAAAVTDAWSADVAAGCVLIVDRPLPALAPLLWRASGLVARTGGPGAHLFEVAGSVGVPTVVADIDARDGDLVSVDGTGTVWVA